MKKIIFSLVFMISCQASWGQCPTDPANNIEICKDGKGISTNPDAPINCEGADASGVPIDWRQNDFDWRIQNIQTNQSIEYYDIQRPGYDGNGDPNTTPVMNPFTGPTDAEYYGNLTFASNSEYHPEDGWELLKLEFGTPEGDPDEYFPKLPYMMLYNKYSSTLRFFGTLVEPHASYKTIAIKMSIPKYAPDYIPGNGSTNYYQSDLNATNLLSIQGQSIQPLDQETVETTLMAFVEYTNNEENFFWFDIPVAYDPCVCQFKSQFDVSFKFVQEADIEVSGDINGSIKTSTVSSGSNSYPVKVMGKVLAAGIATLTAIATKGTIINVKAYIELVDIFLAHPNISAANKKKLSHLKNVLGCTGDFAKLIKGNYKDLMNDDTTDITQVHAGLKIMDGSVKYYSALEKGCKKDKSATTITGRIKAEGTFTLTDNITDTHIELALPGSKWDEELGKRSAPSLVDGELIPAYPLYNERLGTFALLKTPVVHVLTQQVSCEQHLEREPSISWSMKLSSDILYAMNPILNLDLENTLILGRIVIHKDAFFDNQHSYPDRCESFYPFNTNINFEHFPGSEYEIVSPYVSIDYLKNMPLRFDWTSSIEPNIEDHVFIQFKLIAKSNNIGSDGDNNLVFQTLTFPVNLKNTTFDPNGEVATGNYIQEALTLNSDLVFDTDTSLYYEGPIHINANISTAPDATVTIYSINGFIIEEESNISPNVHLIAKPHLEKVPQPEANIKVVTNFCLNDKEYKAKKFSPKSFIKKNDPEEDKSTKRESAEKDNSEYVLFPNPTDGIVNLRSNSASGSYKVLDMNGRPILHGAINSVESTIDFSDVISGFYLLQILDDENQITYKKIIKN